MTDTTQALPDVALADQLMELRELAAQLRRQAAQADQLIAQADADASHRPHAGRDPRSSGGGPDAGRYPVTGPPA